ncbi:MAG: polymerase [Euryarchaeota archaeon]|nr:polymerase [Euryarchaeota archaeon]
MGIVIPDTRAELVHQLHDPLLKNSIFIMLTSISSAGFGFIFWMLAAKLYPADDVGIATALISSMSLIVLLSGFGLDSSIIRFSPTSDMGGIFSTSALITTSFAVLFGTIFIAGADIFSPELHLLKSPQNVVLFLIFLAANSVIELIYVSFVAIRKAELQFLQSIIVGSRILFLIPLIAIGAIGIFCAVGISFMLALLFALVFLMRSGIVPRFVIDCSFLNNAFHFSAGNYFVGLFTTAPNMILPIMVMNTLGAEQAAYYYITFAMASLLYMIPNAISMSLFVEGSHGETIKRLVVKSLFAILLLLIPAAVVLYVCGGWVLGAIGEDYAAGGLQVLRVMVVASLFVGTNYVYFAIKRVQKDVRGIVVLSGVIGGLLVGLGHVFMHMFGIVGVGYAWVASYGIGSMVVGMIVWKKVREI